MPAFEGKVSPTCAIGDISNICLDIGLQEKARYGMISSYSLPNKRYLLMNQVPRV